MEAIKSKVERLYQILDTFSEEITKYKAERGLKNINTNIQIEKSRTKGYDRVLEELETKQQELEIIDPNPNKLPSISEEKANEKEFTKHKLELSFYAIVHLLATVIIGQNLPFYKTGMIIYMITSLVICGAVIVPHYLRHRKTYLTKDEEINAAIDIYNEEVEEQELALQKEAELSRIISDVEYAYHSSMHNIENLEIEKELYQELIYLIDTIPYVENHLSKYYNDRKEAQKQEKGSSKKLINFQAQ